MKLKERIKAAWPKKEEMLPFLGSFGIALLSKAPLVATNTAGMLLISDQMREYPQLIPLGITAYAIFNLASSSLDYAVLKRDRVSASAKANTLYRVMTFLFPENHRFNAVTSEIGTIAMNIIGINPDLTAPASTVLSLVTGDPIYAVSQRISDMAVSLATLVPYNIYLYNKKRL